MNTPEKLDMILAAQAIGLERFVQTHEFSPQTHLLATKVREAKKWLKMFKGESSSALFSDLSEENTRLRKENKQLREHLDNIALTIARVQS